jgi:hypothetical protein
LEWIINASKAIKGIDENLKDFFDSHVAPSVTMLVFINSLDSIPKPNDNDDNKNDLESNS